MDEIMNEPYRVYIRVDDSGRVVAINSSAFLLGTDGWTEIDSGTGDRYHHAQGNYLPLPLMDERGIYRYKLMDGKAVERTAEEMDADWVEPESVPSQLDRVEAQALYTALMTDTLIEEV